VSPEKETDTHVVDMSVIKPCCVDERFYLLFSGHCCLLLVLFVSCCYFYVVPHFKKSKQSKESVVQL
jgi:hypothetical protein